MEMPQTESQLIEMPPQINPKLMDLPQIDSKLLETPPRNEQQLIEIESKLLERPRIDSKLLDDNPNPTETPRIASKLFEIDDPKLIELAEIGSTKLAETRDSISSMDSDVSLSFDKTTAAAADADSNSDSASDTGGKDSGCEVSSEPPFTPPSAELAEKITQQVEFYFSDANITKDAFLLKHVKRNKEGFVSLKLIASFKRVKHLCKDWRVVAHALADSRLLEINEAGTKLRRLQPLPQYDETTPSRTVVAVGVAAAVDRVTIESVAELFKRHGEIALIRILRPGNPVPADVRQFVNKNPSLAGEPCALVEFVHSEAARAALRDSSSSSATMRVYELNGVPHPERKKKTAGNGKKSAGAGGKMAPPASDSDYVSECQSGSEAEDGKKFDPRNKMRRGSSAHFPSRFIEPAAWLQRRLSASSTEANFIYMPRRLSYSSRDSSDSSLFMSRRMSACSISSTDSYNRRMSTASQSSEYSNPRSRSNSSAFQNTENVLRLPKGPDGSRGFRQRLPTVAQ